MDNKGQLYQERKIGTNDEQNSFVCSKELSYWSKRF
jgi:hypothetical protein